jgi:hypothetical protein
MNPVRQSTAFEIAVGPVLDADGVAVTDCVIADFKLKKTTGNFAAFNGSATLTHVSAGVYDLVGTTSDSDTVGMLTVAIDDTVNACSPVRLQVLADAGYDPATNKVQGVVLTDTVTTYTGNTPQTGDAFARLGAPAGASVSADIADVEGKVDDLETRIGTPSDLGSGATVAANLVDIESQTDDIGAAGAGLTALATQASVNTIDDFLDTEIAALTTELAKVPKSDGTATWNATALASINSEADTALSDYGALKPTTVGRTLDVTATGAAGIDWGNIENPTTAVNLSATNIDTDQVVASVTGAVGSVTGNVGGNVTGSVGSVATGGIAAASFAAGAIDAAAIAANAIGASELAADAVAEIADAVWDEAQSGHTTAGTFGKYLDTEVSGVGGGSAPTAAEVADAVWDEALSGHATAGSAGAGLSAAQSAGDPWSTALPGAYADGTAGKIIGNVIPAKTNLIGESIELNAPVTDEDGGTTITVFRTDDYTTTTGQQISVTVSGWPSFPSNGVKLRASRDNSASLIFSEISCTVSASGTDQTLTADLTKEQAVLLRYGKLDDWRIEATYANGDIATPAWGKWNVLRVGT